jgi:putative glutathione S-transferase
MKTVAHRGQADDGTYTCLPDAIRDWVSADGTSEFPAVGGRYHLYVSWACPYAHRVIIARQLLGLQAVVSMSAVDPIRDERGWAFRDGIGFSKDPINGFQFLKEAYLATDAGFSARVTVPVLWDKVGSRIVSNSDDDIMRMLETAFAPLGETPLDLYPTALRPEIDTLSAWIGDQINIGVYETGFSTTQEAYEIAVQKVFDSLDTLDERLASRRYLLADQPLDSDWRLFTTLVRFDAVYYSHFKCSIRRISDYPHLSGYLRDLYQYPGIAETVDMDQIKRHYYCTHPDINPNGIVPVGPHIDLMAPHGRAGLA